MKRMCQIYLPSFYRSYGEKAFRAISCLIPTIEKAGFAGIYLIALWTDGGYDNGFDVVDYLPDPKYGSHNELLRLIGRIHSFGMTVGVDVIPNHVSDQHILAKNCLEDVAGYEDCLYVVDKDAAKRWTDAGVPSFFGKHAYSKFGDKYVRSTFVDYHQLNLNWRSGKVQQYFATLFKRLRAIGIDFARIDCGMLLLEDVTKANRENPFACMNPKASIEAVRAVAGGMPLFFEWFDPSTANLFENMPDCYALDCSYVVTGHQSLNWHHPKLVPLLGGHDQMTVADRGIDVSEAVAKAEESNSGYCFLDIQTLVGWKTMPGIQPDDRRFDADLGNSNQRFRGRRPIDACIKVFLRSFN